MKKTVPLNTSLDPTKGCVSQRCLEMDLRIRHQMTGSKMVILWMTLVAKIVLISIDNTTIIIRIKTTRILAGVILVRAAAAMQGSRHPPGCQPQRRHRFRLRPSPLALELKPGICLGRSASAGVCGLARAEPNGCPSAGLRRDNSR